MHYIGGELELFAGARNWKSYWSRQVAPFLGAEVLEVGAGLGGTTRFLCTEQQTRWVCLEPDPELAAELQKSIDREELRACCEVRVGTLADIARAPSFDSVVYADVLEHIEQDRSELAEAVARLRSGGHLIVLAPAHPWLFSEFDRAVGHYRRYTRPSLLKAAPAEMVPVRCLYLDSAGILLSLGNRCFLRQSVPSRSAIAFWDRCVVPISRICDRLVLHRAGKSVLAVWRRP